MKTKKYFCDPLAAAMASVWLFIAMPFCSAALIYGTLIYENNGIETILDVFIVIIFYLLDIALYVISIYCVSQWYASVKLTTTGIIYIIPFRKKKEIAYEYFKYVKIAYYTHIFKKRHFLVMSQKYILSSDLCNINQLKSDNTIVKLNLSNKNYRSLCRVLPDNITKELESFFNNCQTNIAFDIAAEKTKALKLITRKRKRKKK